MFFLSCQLTHTIVFSTGIHRLPVGAIVLDRPLYVLRPFAGGRTVALSIILQAFAIASQRAKPHASPLTPAQRKQKTSYFSQPFVSQPPATSHQPPATCGPQTALVISAVLREHFIHAGEKAPWVKGGVFAFIRIHWVLTV